MKVPFEEGKYRKKTQMIVMYKKMDLSLDIINTEIRMNIHNSTHTHAHSYTYAHSHSYTYSYTHINHHTKTHKTINT